MPPGKTNRYQIVRAKIKQIHNILLTHYTTVTGKSNDVKLTNKFTF